MIRKAKSDGKWIVSGFMDDSQKDNIIKVGFSNKIFQIFNTEDEADNYIKETILNSIAYDAIAERKQKDDIERENKRLENERELEETKEKIRSEMFFRSIGR